MSIEQRWDRQRDHLKHETSPRHQKRAVADLVAYLHGFIALQVEQGLLLPEIEKALRTRVNTVCVEFDMDRLPERVPA